MRVRDGVSVEIGDRRKCQEKCRKQVQVTNVSTGVTEVEGRTRTIHLFSCSYSFKCLQRLEQRVFSFVAILGFVTTRLQRFYSNISMYPVTSANMLNQGSAVL